MIFDLPAEIQLAIRLRALKDRVTTGQVIERVIIECFPREIDEARKIEQERLVGKQCP